jgi:hypothetical protein
MIQKAAFDLDENGLETHAISVRPIKYKAEVTEKASHNTTKAAPLVKEQESVYRTLLCLSLKE